MRQFYGFLAKGLLALVLAILLAVPAMAAGIPSDPNHPAYRALFPPVENAGELPVTIAASPGALGRVIVAGFGVPFPPGFVSDPNNIALVDNLGMEIPIHVTVLARWPEPVPGAGSIRAAMVQFMTLMGTKAPRVYKIRWGAPRAQSEPRGWAPRTNWVEATGGGYPKGSVKQPPVMAAFEAKWLGKCLLKGRIMPGYSNPMDDIYDRAMKYYFNVAINNVSPKMPPKKRINYVGSHEPWLYDRSMSFFVTYFRNGKLDVYRQAHWAAQYYASKISPTGQFLLLKSKSQIDIKYCYQECLAMDYWFTGDDKLLRTAKHLYPIFTSWNYHYKPHGGFWTERHFAFSMLGAITNYELTGNKEALELAREIFEVGLQMQFDPAPGVPRGAGCLVHLGRQHGERGVDDLWVCSPWMSGLYIDALIRYYVVTADSRVPQAISAMGNFLATRGIHNATLSPRLPKYAVPYYLVNVQGPVRTEVEPWSDRQHACDALGSLACADWFIRKGGGHSSLVQDKIKDVKKTMAWVFEPCLRKTSFDDRGLPLLNLGPPRKYNWWFRTSASWDWYLKN